MDRDRFDDLTKRLALEHPSRRRLLAGLGGAVLGGLGLHGASAAKGGNSACAHFCAQLFGADTPEAGQCTSQAAHGTGPCYQCGGPAAGANACPSGQVCLDNGTCATSCDPRNPMSCGDPCVCIQDASLAGYCTSSVTVLPCATDRDCHQGQFCQRIEPSYRCAIAC